MFFIDGNSNYDSKFQSIKIHLQECICQHQIRSLFCIIKKKCKGLSSVARKNFRRIKFLDSIRKPLYVEDKNGLLALNAGVLRQNVPGHNILFILSFGTFVHRLPKKVTECFHMRTYRQSLTRSCLEGGMFTS